MHQFYQTSHKAFLTTLINTASKRKPISEFVSSIYTTCLKNFEAANMDERRFEYYLSQIYVELAEPMIVWHTLEKLNMSRLSNKLPILCYLSSTRNFKSCLTEIVRLQDIILTPTYSIRILQEEENIILEVKDKNFNSPTPHYRNDFALSLILHILREFVGKEFNYAGLKFPVSRPNFVVDEIRQITHSAVSLHKGPAQALISRKSFGFSNPLFDPTSHDQWRKEVDQLVASTQITQSLASKVVSELELNEQPARATLDSMAEHFAMSVSTFRRVLDSENCSFKDIKSRFLDELSITDLLTSEIKVDALALKLGYSERSTFERAFKNRTGRSPSQYRELAGSIFANQKDLTIEVIAQSMPPLPETCLKLIEGFNKDTLTVESVVRIIEKDPIFISRIMGLASRAVYGSAPKSLAEAIGHKLGMEVVKNLAIVFATKDSLKDEIQDVNIDAHIQAFLIGPRVYQLLIKATSRQIKFELEAVNQTLTIGALGFLLMCHKKLTGHQTFTNLVDDSEDLQSLLIGINENLDYSIFGTSIILLSYWGIENKVIKNLSKLEQHLSKGASINEDEEFLLFTYEVMFELAMRNSASDKLKSRAENIFGISNIDDIFAQLIEK